MTSSSIDGSGGLGAADAADADRAAPSAVARGGRPGSVAPGVAPGRAGTPEGAGGRSDAQAGGADRGAGPKANGAGRATPDAPPARADGRTAAERAAETPAEPALDPAGGGPLFTQIAMILRDRIVSGQIGPGARLPSEIEICAAWSVSRITAKRALDTLAAEGLVTRARGRGTTVLDAAAAPPVAARLGGWMESTARLAAATRLEVLDLRYLGAPAHVARELDVAPGADVQRALRVRSIEAGPVAHLESWLPGLIGRRLRAEDLARAPLVTVLEKAGVVVASARQTVTASTAAPEVAAALGVAAGAALLDVRRRKMDRAGRPVAFVRALYRPDRYRYEMELLAEPPAPRRRG